MTVNLGIFRGGPRRGQFSKSVAGAADVTLTPDEIYESLVLTGALTGNISVIFPFGTDEAGMNLNVENQTTGNFSVSLKKSGGTGLEIGQGRRISVIWSGSVFAPEDTVVQSVTVTIAAAAIAALRATPATLVAAPGAGKMLEFISAVLILDWVTPGFTESDDNLAVRYTDGSGVIVSQAIECTGFIDQVADTATTALAKIDAIAAKTGCENKALVLHNTGDGEFGGSGGSALRVKVFYRTHVTGW